jgi:hypothetical protein
MRVRNPDIAVPRAETPRLRETLEAIRRRWAIEKVEWRGEEFVSDELVTLLNAIDGVLSAAGDETPPKPPRKPLPTEPIDAQRLFDEVLILFARYYEGQERAQDTVWDRDARAFTTEYLKRADATDDRGDAVRLGAVAADALAEQRQRAQRTRKRREP